jgi:hypothetical protein
MPTTVNLLPWYDSLSTTGDDGVTVSLANTEYPLGWDADNATLSISPTDLNVTNKFVALANPSSGQKVTYRLRNVKIAQDMNGSGLSFNCKLKTLEEVTVSTKLWIDSASAVYFVDPETNIAQSASSTVSYPVQSNTKKLFSGLYNAVYSNTAYVPNDLVNHYANVDIEVTGHNVTPIKMTNPNLIRELGFYENPFVGQFRHLIPDFYWSIDSEESFPSYPFYRLIDILTSFAGDARREFTRMYGYEQDDLYSPEQKLDYFINSSLVSPSSVREEYMPWLAQFTGSDLKQNFQLPDGSFYLDNLASAGDYTEWQLRNSYYGRAAGSRQSMIDSAKRVLIKTDDEEQSTLGVSLTPKFGGNPWAIRIQTLANETLDAAAGESSSLVLSAVELSRPLGFEITHLTVQEFLLTLDDITLGVLGEYPLG